MERLNLPEYQFRLKREDGKIHIFDSIRKKFLVLTPEEWVRQNFIEYLHQEFQYPKSLMKLEKPIKYNRMDNRSDIVCYNNRAEALVLVECKRPSVEITQKTFDQIARYNSVLQIRFLAVTNGLNHYYCEIDHDKGSYRFIESLPEYQSQVG
ncbi:type I restriction enzyme HsdR N-terminal domain-containing protein [bacterium SCSIO 12741]|nr:type I restriction enzyme HsdR N-terminal domain-containing protein [bacterium SCSIO 12741]